MKKLIIPMLLSLSFSAFADLSLPQISAPDELVRGDFAEGTITQISSAEIAEFLPWAQNAKNQLTRALNTARTLPLRDRRTHIERSIRSVVNRSGDRQYQMFMRFSLNRGLLLVSEMSKTMDMTAIGAQESALDILQRSIEVALSFYESDLSFQNRAVNENTTTALSYAQFATTFKNSLYAGVINVLDAKAQYRLLYKLVEMVNWDISRDAHANNYADSIVEAYELLQDLHPEPADDDRLNLRFIRRLNTLKILGLQGQGNSGQAGSESSLSTPELSRFMFDTYNSVVRKVKARAANGFVVFEDGVTRGPDYLQKLVTSYGGISMGDQAFDSYNSVVRTVAYVTEGGIYVFDERVVRNRNYVQSLLPVSSSGIRSGDQALDTYNNVIRTVRYVTSGKIYIFTDGVVRSEDYVSKLL